MIYNENIDILEKVVKERAIIRNVSKHRNPDGTIDIDGNLKIWDEVMARFKKIKLWDKTPGFDSRDLKQSEPFMVFIPALQVKETKGTIVVAHGGGFELRTGCEGVHTAKYFHDAGFNVAILSYRLLPYSRLDCFDDMQRSIRTLRAKKDELNISDKIFVMGFSAGGMLSANCATQFDAGNETAQDIVERQSSRPDGAVIGYGAMSAISFPIPFGMEMEWERWGTTAEERLFLAPEKNINWKTPPFFIWQTLSDDGRYGMCLAKALQDAGIPYELHIFQQGVHGMAMADGNNDLDMEIPHVAHWGELCKEWLELIE